MPSAVRRVPRGRRRVRWPYLGVRLQAEGDDRRASARRQLLGEPPAVGVAHVDRGGRRLGPRRRGGARPRSSARVSVGVEAIPARVCRRRSCRASARPPAVPARRVRRGLHRAAAVAPVEHLGERCAAGRWPPASSARRAGARRRPGSRPCRAARRRPAAARTAWSRKAVVVLPFVPVTPATSSSRVGRPKKRSAAGAMVSRESGRRRTARRARAGALRRAPPLPRQRPRRRGRAVHAFPPDAEEERARPNAARWL